MRARHRWLLTAVLAALLTVPAEASGVGLQPLAPSGSFEQPIFVTSDPANADRIFVVEREGVIKRVQGGVESTFADLTSVVRCCESERGLFSIALPPDFSQTGRLYVHYTGEDGPGNLHVAELTANGNTASVASLRNLLTIGHSQAPNHNGGQLQFGPDGHLYVSTGDGGTTPDQARSLSSLLGKILRIDPRPNGSAAYTVPSGNPFVGGPGADEIWAYGLRNPWRFSFDRQSGDLLLTDVGQQTYEELNYSPLSAGLGRGADYGWNCREGAHPYAGAPGACAGLVGFIDPIFEYTQAGGGCAITGGYVVRDPTLDGLLGRYLYSDFCHGQLRSLAPGPSGAGTDRAEGLAFAAPVSFGEDSCGRLYVVEAASNVYRLTGTGAPGCKVLRVSVKGGRRGRITGSGIDCPPDCVEVFPQPGRVVLRKQLRKRSNFAGWNQECNGRKRCAVTMTQDRQVGARFKGPLRTRVRLVAADRQVAAGAKARLRVRAFPCKGRRRDLVKLYRGRNRIGKKRLSRRCTARFSPRVGNRSSFRAKVRADLRHRAGKSARVVIAASG